jgi:hypothetical protein
MESEVRKRRRLLYANASLLAFALVGLSASHALASACPNEALRSELESGQLPNCRAYELISAGYKESQPVSNAFAVSRDGSHFIGGGLGVFGGAAGDGLGRDTDLVGAVYEFSRGAGVGWTATSLDPPGSLFTSNGMFDAGAELGATLWELGRRKVSPPGAPAEEAQCPERPGEEEAQPEGVTDFYLEQPIGTFTRIGPATPNACIPNADHYDYLGGSTDLSRVLFSAHAGYRWPFDGTAASGGTLYEYVGVDNSEPYLVGVNGGRGSTELMSRCGTRLGDSTPEEELNGSILKGSMYNAVSASGGRVFFTAVGRDEPGCAAEAPPVGELFAREEVSVVTGELPASEWRTVPISEPSEEDCKACLTGEASRKDAVFQGASEDGSKVFFTTEQELLPGAKGENLYEYNFGAPEGERVALVSSGAAADAEVQGVARISEDGTHVYFVAGGVLTSEPRGGGCLSGLGPSELAEEEATKEGRCRPKKEADNLYAYAEGHTSFVVTLSPSDAGDWAREDNRPVLTSSEGRFLVFTSAADLIGEGLSVGRSQVFQYDAATGGLVRASIGQGGFDGNDRAPLAGSTIVNGFPHGYSYASADSPASANGAQAPEDGAVFFQSPDALTPQALNDQPNPFGGAIPNIYEYSAGNVYLLSDGRDASVVDTIPSVSLIGSDPSGSDVLFYTADPLIARDEDTQQDIYDARVDGGIPNLALQLGCAGEACRGPLAAAPALAPLGGTATQAAEEAPPAVFLPVLTKVKPKAKKPAKKPKVKSRRKARPRRASRAALHGRRHERRAR